MKGSDQMIGIYKITNNINGHCYIGQSVDIKTRWHHHRNYPVENSNYPLYLAFKKYGLDNFSFEIVEECEISELDEKEIFYIQQFNSYENGYNQTLGGSGRRGSVVKISLNDLYEIYELLLHSNLTQREIAILYKIGEDTLSEINQGKTRQLEGYSYPLRKNKNDKNYCIDCGKEILFTSTRCAKCSKIASRLNDRPSREELKIAIRTRSFLDVGRQYGVSDNSIRKWCIGYNLPSKKTDIKKYSDIEWQAI